MLFWRKPPLVEVIPFRHLASANIDIFWPGRLHCLFIHYPKCELMKSHIASLGSICMAKVGCTTYKHHLSRDGCNLGA